MKQNKKQVFIIGGGASGLAAAIFAARAGASVTVLEKEKKPGRKLLRTGNGRCNLANLGPLEGNYHGLHPEFARFVLKTFSREKLFAFFEEIGIRTRDCGGWIYPASETAESVLACLLLAARELSVRIRTNVCVKTIRKQNGRFLIDVGGYVYTADRVILSAGSRASLEPSGENEALAIAAAFGHRILPIHPALTALTVEDSKAFGFAGVRIRGKIRLFADGKLFHEERGQLQFTEYGISGIPVFNGSSEAVKALAAGKQVAAEADLFPDMEETLFISYLKERFERLKERSVQEKLTGLLPDKMIAAILREPGSPEQLAARIRHFPMTVNGFKGMKYAQVMGGGVDTDEIDPATMASKITEGLYICGELLDIDGACGGYNLMFAFAGGAAAGTAQGDY
ncbi:MAG: aminoacetone oxidase family FAD-binding enzyme [Lachnospiraceae bacterium]|nr:aminoacetone oxidase family FAD-binding enzyme [Lachnospiraceae bacterium]